jgi:4-amino-4-deoxy-L-arabinose transferase-like glycosyltransferase
MNRFHRSASSVILVIGFALMAGAGLRLYLMGSCSAFGSDSFHYLELARGLVERGAFESRGSQHPDLSRYPLFPVLIAIGSACGLSWEASGKAVPFLSSLALAAPLWFLAGAAFGRRSRLPAAVIGAVSCAAAGSTTMFPDPLAALLFVSLAASLLVTLLERSTVAAVATGISACLASLTRPEGVLWGITALSVAVAVSALRRKEGRRSWFAVAIIACIFVPGYLAYVAWVSAGLNRLCWSPGIEYVRSVREVGERYRVRGFELDGVSWEDRATFLLDAERTEFVLAVRFETDRLPEVDPRWRPGLAQADPDSDRSGSFQETPPVSKWSVLQRRIYMVRQNLLLVPGALRSNHLLPPVPVVLVLIGCLSGLRSRKSRRGLAFLTGAGLVSLLPLVSHIEGRFLLPGFVLACAAGGRGWAALELSLARVFRRRSWIRPTFHGVVFVGIAASTFSHARVCPRPLDRERLYREAGAVLERVSEEGPVLAVLPHVPWFGNRPYLRLPLGGPGVVSDFARSAGAERVGIHLPYDRKRRRDRGPLLETEPPPGYRRIACIEGSAGDQVLVLAVDHGEKP